MARTLLHGARQALCVGALAAWAGAAGAADIPDPVKKLTGSSEDTVRSVMAQQGFALRNQKTSWGRDYSYWWNGKSRQCVQLMSLAGRVVQVQPKGESDCVPGATRPLPGASAPSAALDPLTLPGQPRAVGDERLLKAGFRSVEATIGTDDTSYVTWTDGQRCLGVRIVGERYERVDEIGRKGCYLK